MEGQQRIAACRFSAEFCLKPAVPDAPQLHPGRGGDAALLKPYFSRFVLGSRRLMNGCYLPGAAGQQPATEPLLSFGFSSQVTVLEQLPMIVDRLRWQL